MLGPPLVVRAQFVCQIHLHFANTMKCNKTFASQLVASSSELSRVIVIIPCCLNTLKNKHLKTGPKETVTYVFPRPSIFPEAKPKRGTLRVVCQVFCYTSQLKNRTNCAAMAIKNVCLTRLETNLLRFQGPRTTWSHMSRKVKLFVSLWS